MEQQLCAYRTRSGKQCEITPREGNICGKHRGRLISEPCKGLGCPRYTTSKIGWCNDCNFNKFASRNHNRGNSDEYIMVALSLRQQLKQNIEDNGNIEYNQVVEVY